MTWSSALVGHVCIDHNRSEHATYKGWGSSVLYMGNYIKETYEWDAIVISSYGPDVLEYLPDVTLLPVQPPESGTLIYENDTRTGRRIQSCRNLDYAKPPVLDEDSRNAIGSSEVVVVAPLLDNYSLEYVRQLTELASPHAIKVLCPQGYFRHVQADGRVTFQDFDALADIVSLFDLVFFSEEDHPRAFELANQWSSRFPKMKIVITQGSAGASIVEKGVITSIPTTPIPLEEVVDSVGCGDVFAASAAYHYYKHHDLPRAIKEAHKAAAVKLLAVTV